ncbi:TIGR04255 family protein [Pseudomonas chlororaphis subsp. aurantiaca]|uniref:TIGR04255 family protein n=1 Tax=Pseudomonas chlororaphis TaxID=587753 RepID=UPI0027DE7027|nr:TIGR04255 family protein [Pseudomonas chlororaphis]WMJ01195.1 TIGR04255 family protein [Pseudomonas chlororaphis subsp. aurantiaca]
MTKRFENPPLIELVAELRWTDPEPATNINSNLDLTMRSDLFERTSKSLTSVFASKGYGSSERLNPVGFPMTNGQVAIRYKYSGNESLEKNSLSPAALFQLGMGVFTINATRPYSSWSEFSNIVRCGVESLLKENGSEVKEYQLRMRYLDAFKKDLVGDLGFTEFLDNIFNIKVSLPSAMTDIGLVDKASIPHIQISLPVKLGSVRVKLAKGKVDAESAFIMETVISFAESYEPNTDSIMEAFSEGRELVHNMFMSISEPLHHKMKPV